MRFLYFYVSQRGMRLTPLGRDSASGLLPSKKKYKERRRKGAPLIMSRSS